MSLKPKSMFILYTIYFAKKVDFSRKNVFNQEFSIRNNNNQCEIVCFLILVYLNLLNLVIKCSISGKSDYAKFFSDNKRLHVSWLNSNRPHAI